jgi:hypothetical protein
MAPTTSALDELDAAPPAAFVRTRNALVARLRKAGHTREAAEIARRRRPSVVLWLVSRLASTDPAGIRGLLESAERLRRASLRNPRTIAEATTSHRAALQRLMEHAEKILVDAGMRPSPEVLRRVHVTLSAAAADRRQHAPLRQGRLAEEIAPGGFEVLGGTPTRHLALVRPVPVDKPRTERVEPPPTKPTERAATRRQLQAERRDARQREAEAAKRQRSIARASRRAERLREQLRRVEEQIEREGR